MVTLDDVAARAGVSRMTASNALNGKAVVRPATAERVLAAAAELGYRPNIAARQLSSGRTHIIGLTIADFDLIFPADLAAHISDLAAARGYQVIVQQTRFSHDFEQRMMASPASQICDGTIVCWPSSDPAEMAQFGRSHPLVVLDGFGLEGQCDCVFTPCVEGMAAAARHLADAGCQRVLVLGGHWLAPSEFANAASSEQMRVRGAGEGLLAAGLDWRSEDVIPCGWSREAGYDTMTRLLKGTRAAAQSDAKAQRDVLENTTLARTASNGQDSEESHSASLWFDGVCCLNDPIAIGAMKALQDAGVDVPGQVKITGFDGVADGRYLTPGLTTVTIDPADVARTCLDLLIDRIEGNSSSNDNEGTPFHTETLPHTLTPRGSAERNGGAD